MIVIVILAIAQLSCAALPMRMRNLLDPQAIEIDDIEGFLYDVPEFEDPLLIQHQLSSVGAMPIFTLLQSAKKRGNSKSDDIPEKVRIAESKRVVDDAMSRLELAKAKLEKGNANIFTDIEKVIQRLKTLEGSSRPNMRQALNSLQSIMTMARPINIAGLKELLTTDEPESNEKIGVLEEPQNFERQTLNIRLLPGEKSSESDEKRSESDDKRSESDEKQSESEEKPVLNNPQDSSLSTSVEKSSEEERMAEERSKLFVSSEKPNERFVATKPPFEFKIKEKKNTNYDGEDVMSSYKLTWKAAGIV